MASTAERNRERQVVEEVSADELMKHTAWLAERDRESGTEGEAQAVRYFKEVMERHGLDVQILEVENFLSLPLRASLKVVSPEQKEVQGITTSFSITTPAGGLEAELVYVPSGSDVDVKGKITLAEGLASPMAAWTMEQKGAIGQVWINAGDLPRNMIVTTIWGHPTPETAWRIPKSAVMSVNQASGDSLKALCARGPVKVRLETETWTGFKKLPLAVAEVKGKVEPDKYVLFNGHIDSWHRGASDNGTANACILETARILARHRDELRRGVRFVWWSGHSHGRYSGSTWYADHNWEDLHRNAIIHLNVDSLGCQGATDYSEVECSAEAYELGRSALQDYTGQTPHYARIGRSGDQSFWGVGLPSLYQLLSRQPAGKDAGVFIPGLPWFWHTSADTLDKIDREILEKDVRVYMATLWRLCTSPVLPFSFVGVAEEFQRLLSDLQQKAGDAFDLQPALERAEELRARAVELDRAREETSAKYAELGEAKADQQLGARSKALDRCLMTLSRLLMPVSYSAVDRFDLDLALPVPPLPGLQRVAQMASMDRNSDDFKFLERKMLRERNKVCHALRSAAEVIAETV